MDERARMGLFLAMRYPSEIPGITNAEGFSDTNVNLLARKTMKKISVQADFITKLDEKMELLSMKEERMTTLYLNDFSGGEKT